MKIKREDTRAYKAYQKVINWAESQEGKARRFVRRMKAHQELLPFVIEGLKSDVELDENSYLEKATEEISESIAEFLDAGYITEEQAISIL